MSLEIIPSALLTAGSAGLAGFLIGFAIKKVMKLIAIIGGVFIGALFYLQSQSIISVEWTKLQSISESALSSVSNSLTSTAIVSSITTNLGLPLTGGFSAGIILGLAKG